MCAYVWLLLKVWHPVRNPPWEAGSLLLYKALLFGGPWQCSRCEAALIMMWNDWVEFSHFFFGGLSYKPSFFQMFLNVDICRHCTHTEMDWEFLGNGCTSFGAKPVLGLVPKSSRSLEERALMSPFPSSAAFLFLPLFSHWSASSQAEVQPQPILKLLFIYSWNSATVFGKPPVSPRHDTDACSASLPVS